MWDRKRLTDGPTAWYLHDDDDDDDDDDNDDFVFLSPTKMSEEYLQLGHDGFLPYTSLSNSNPNIRR